MEQKTRKRGLDLLMVLTLILALGTIVQDFRFDSSLERERLAAAAIDRDLTGVQLAAAELQVAQSGYGASGTAGATALARASSLAGQIETTLSRLAGTSTIAAAQAQFDAATGAFADLMNVDKRARDEVRTDQRLVATDLLSLDGAAAAQRLDAAISPLRETEAQAAAERITRLSQLRFGMNTVVLGFVLIVAFRAVRSASRIPVSEPVSTAQMFRELPPPVKPAVTTAPGTATRVTAPLPPVNLPSAAELCVDLARVLDGRDVPALLERTAGVLDAKGVILWVANSDGASLRPSVAFGYPEKILMRLGALPIDADNVTSLAFRSVQPQSIAATAAGAPGALAVPLVSTTGCVGVLAAEIRSSRPPAEVIAIARIIAAQFATLLGPDAAAAPHAAEA